MKPTRPTSSLSRIKIPVSTFNRPSIKHEELPSKFEQTGLNESATTSQETAVEASESPTENQNKSEPSSARNSVKFFMDSGSEPEMQNQNQGEPSAARSSDSSPPFVEHRRVRADQRARADNPNQSSQERSSGNEAGPSRVSHTSQAQMFRDDSKPSGNEPSLLTGNTVAQARDARGTHDNLAVADSSAPDNAARIDSSAQASQRDIMDYAISISSTSPHSSTSVRRFSGTESSGGSSKIPRSSSSPGGHSLPVSSDEGEAQPLAGQQNRPGSDILQDMPPRPGHLLPIPETNQGSPASSSAGDSQAASTSLNQDTSPRLPATTQPLDSTHSQNRLQSEIQNPCSARTSLPPVVPDPVATALVANANIGQNPAFVENDPFIVEAQVLVQNPPVVAVENDPLLAEAQVLVQNPLVVPIQNDRLIAEARVLVENDPLIIEALANIGQNLGHNAALGQNIGQNAIPTGNIGQNALIIARNAGFGENSGQQHQNPLQPGGEIGGETAIEHFNGNPSRTPPEPRAEPEMEHFDGNPYVPDYSDARPFRPVRTSVSWGWHFHFNNWKVSISPTIQAALNYLNIPRAFIYFKAEPSFHGLSVPFKSGFGTQWETKLQCCKWHLFVEKGKTGGVPYLEAGVQRDISDIQSRFHLNGLGIPSRLGGGIKSSGKLFTSKWDAIFGTLATRSVHKFKFVDIQGKTNFCPSPSISVGPFSVNPLQILQPIHHNSNNHDVEVQYVRLTNLMNQVNEKSTRLDDDLQKLTATANNISQKIDENHIITDHNSQQLAENQIMSNNNAQNFVATLGNSIMESINEHVATLTTNLHELTTNFHDRTNTLSTDVDKILEQSQHNASNLKQTLLANHHELKQGSIELLHTVQMQGNEIQNTVKTQGLEHEDCCNDLKRRFDNLDDNFNDKMHPSNWLPRSGFFQSTMGVFLVKKLLPFVKNSTILVYIVIVSAIIGAGFNYHGQLLIKHESSKEHPSRVKLSILHFFKIPFLAGSTLVSIVLISNAISNIVAGKPLYTSTFPGLGENSKLHLWLRGRVDKINVDPNGNTGIMISVAGQAMLLAFNVMPFVIISVSFVKTRNLTWTVFGLITYYISITKYQVMYNLLETRDCPPLVLPTRIENVKQLGKVFLISGISALEVLDPRTLFELGRSRAVSIAALIADVYKKNRR